MITDIPLISVCVCTYRRPAMLRRLLNSLAIQDIDGVVFDVVVVDNDYKASAAEAVASFKKSVTKFNVHYSVETDQNIARARNRAVASASGRFIAFVDDDEYAPQFWLRYLVAAAREYRADAVFGPVLASYPKGAPTWLVRSGLCDRGSYRTGKTIVDYRLTRTGNVLIAKKALSGIAGPFNPAYGKTGGEDSDLFKRMILRGSRLVWCNEAHVFEEIAPDRLRRMYYIRRALLRGYTNSKNRSSRSLSAMRSVLAIGGYALALPFFAFRGEYMFMDYLVRSCDHVGKILGLCGFRISIDHTGL